MAYRSVRARQDRWLSAALRIVAREEPSWGYRLGGGCLRLRGWQLNDKRVYRLWRLNGLSLPPYRPRCKIRTGDNLNGPARHHNDVWAWDFVRPIHLAPPHTRWANTAYHHHEHRLALTRKQSDIGDRIAVDNEIRERIDTVRKL